MSDPVRSEPRVRTLEPPLAAALAAARAACASAEVKRDEVWRLPAGESALDEALELEIAGHAVTLRGAGTTIRLARGARISAGRLGLEGVAFRCDRDEDALELSASERLELRVVELTRGALRLMAPEVVVEARTRVVDATGAVGLEARGRDVALSGAQVRFAADAPAASSRTGIRATAARTLRATTLAVSAVRGARAAGIELAAPDVVLLEAAAADVEASAGEAVGISVVASDHLEASTLQARGVRGTAAASGLVIGGGAPADAARAEPNSQLRAFDLTAQSVEASDAGGSAAGLVLHAGGAAIVRGFTLRAIHGGAAVGALALFAEASEISVGEIEEVLGRAGRAAGLRALGRGTLDDVFVRDVTARAVGARLAVEPAAVSSAAGPFATAPSEGWRDWIDAAVAAAGDAITQFAGRAIAAARDGDYAAAALPHPTPTLPAWPAEQVLAGVVLDAATDAPPPRLGAEWGALVIRDAVVERVAGPAVQIRGGLRPVKLIGLAAWGCASAGWIQGEDALVAACSLHACGRGLSLGPGVVRAYDLVVTDVGTPPSLVVEADAALARVEGVLTNAAVGVDDPRVLALDALPYVAAGSGALPAALDPGEVAEDEAIDLHLTAAAAARLAALAREVPGEADVPRMVGAFDVPPPPRCAADDPQRRPTPAAQRPPPPGPAIDYRGRDYQGLLEVMLDRARVSMPAWSERSPADFSTLLMEALAYRMDVVAQAQERAVAEGFLDTAQLRRSVEDHARVLDAEPDPGLSATTLLSFSLAPAVLDDPARRAALLDVDGAVRVPAETLVSNGASPTQAVVFATEEPLLLVPELDRLELAEPCAVGATSASLVAREDRAMRFVQPGRWLMFPDGALDGERTGRGHVARITTVERATDTTVIGWDPRRPLPFALPARARILGNVVPAHHGVPLRALAPGHGADGGHPLASLLSLEADGSRGAREVPLPLGPLSVRAAGYPFPHEGARSGVPMIAVSVGGDRWRRVEALATALPSDEVYVVRHEDSVTGTLRFGDGINGAALPARKVDVTVDMSVGLGAAANVGAETLVHVLQLGDAERAPLLEALRVTNPLPALGGRDPEPLGRLRYRAPLGVMEPRSAINLADYERLLAEAEGVRGVRARAVLDGIRPLIRATVLMADEDTIDPAERLRRWAGVRRRMEEIRLLGVDVETVPPRWVPLDLDLVVDAAAHAPAAALREAVMEAIGGDGGLLDPDRATLGGDLQLSSLYQAALAVTGVTAVRVKRFRRLALDARDGAEDGVLAMGPDEVPVVRAPRHPGVDSGVLTVTVCGGLR